MKGINYIKTLLIAIPLCLSYSSAKADNPAPYDFNVYMSGDIGTSTHPYTSDFQGIGGAGGNAYLSGYSGNLNGPAYSYSFYTGDTFNLSNGSLSNGGVDAGGNVILNSTTISGNINGGGSLQGGNGTVTGNVTVAGTNSSSLTINGTVSTGHPYTPSLSLPSVTSYFQNASSFWGSLAPTATFSENFGNIQVSPLSSGRNIVALTFAALNSATSITLSGPANAFVIFNINGTTPTSQLLNAVTFVLSGGITTSDILFNLNNATQLTLSGGTYASVLAPVANIDFTSGVLAGNLIGDNLTGGGQVNSGVFTGFAADQGNFTSAPEPSTYLLIGSFLGVMLFVNRKRKATVSAVAKVQ